MIDYAKLYDFEKSLLDKFTYRIKNEHNSTMVYRKVVHLQRVLKKIDKHNMTTSDLEKVQKCCMDLYVLSTSYIALGHYLGFTYIILGMCGRFHFLIGKLYVNQKAKEVNINLEDEIDSIFK